MKSTIRPDIPGVRDGDQWGGQVLFYVCAGCNRPRRYLYPWEMIDGRLVHVMRAYAIAYTSLCPRLARQFQRIALDLLDQALAAYPQGDRGPLLIVLGPF